MKCRAKAFAKINLYLDVVGKREDGYHLLDTVMQSVGVWDEIEISENGGEQIRVFCDKIELSGEDNIVHKAALSFFEYAGRKTGIDITIGKKIPIAAGTGGGSADAAAVLLMLNRLSGTDYPLEVLERIGLRLGADVPFCLRGGTARACGIGEDLTPLKTPAVSYVLLKNRDKRSTGEMYARLDRISDPVRGDIHAFLEAVDRENTEQTLKRFFNAFAACWDFDEMAKPFEVFSPDAVFLSGSGPTVCAAFIHESAARNCAEALQKAGENALFAPPVTCGVMIE